MISRAALTGFAPIRRHTLTLGCAVCLAAAGLRAQPAVNPTAAALAEFSRQVSAYLDIHKKEEGAVPDVKSGATPAEVLSFEKALDERIKKARATAKQGDIFVPDVVPVFKQILGDYYRRRSSREIRLLLDEVPNFKPDVNMTYPAGAAKATVPPRLALALPTLPDELEFRLVGTSLVLRDTKANLIIDYIPIVLPAAATPKP